MTTNRRLSLLFILALASAATVAAKCPTGSVIVSGRGINLPSDTNVSVVVITKNGEESRSVPLSQGEFEVEIPFSTFSSSFLGGDRCNAVPNFVDVKIASATKVYVQRRLSFKDSFKMTKPYEFRLKEKLSLEVPNEAGRSPT